jgi:hypothetical protein
LNRWGELSETRPSLFQHCALLHLCGPKNEDVTLKFWLTLKFWRSILGAFPHGRANNEDVTPLLDERKTKT